MNYKEFNKQFYLMRKDEPLMEITIDFSYDTVCLDFKPKLISGVSSEFLPYSAWHDNYWGFNTWLGTRGCSPYRYDIRIRMYHMDYTDANPNSYAVRNLSLSLTDCYWIKPADSSLLWKDVNFYENDFGDYNFGDFVKEFEAEGLVYDRITNLTPNAALLGELKKKWIIDDEGNRLLIKGNHGSSYRQSYNEVLASEIHRRQGRHEFTEYKIYPYKYTEYGEEHNEHWCVCPNFTSQNLELISAWEVVNSEKRDNHTSLYDHFINICVKHGLDRDYVEDFLSYQILTDFIISNYDRHFNNFGVLRDTETLKFVKMAPIFDCGNSMFWLNPLDARSSNLSVLKANSFNSTEAALLKHVTDFKIVDLSLLPETGYLRELYSASNSDEKEISAIINAYNTKIKKLKNIQTHNSVSYLFDNN